MPLDEVGEIYLNYGFTGLTCIVFISMSIYVLVKILPILNYLKETSSVNLELVRNNTQAMQEMAKSNDNLATAIKIIDNTMLNTQREVSEFKIDMGDMSKEVAELSKEVTKLNERVK